MSLVVKTLALRDLGPHAQRELSFDRHLTAIVGPNGSGKSFIVRVLAGAIANDWRQLGPNQAAVVRQPGAQTAQVDLEFEWKGQEIRLSRKLPGAKISVHSPVGDAESATRAAELFLLLKIPAPALVLEHLVVTEGRLDEVLDITPHMRELFWQQLAKVDKAQRIYDLTNEARREAAHEHETARQVIAATSAAEGELEAAAASLAQADARRREILEQIQQFDPPRLEARWQESRQAALAVHGFSHRLEQYQKAVESEQQQRPGLEKLRQRLDHRGNQVLKIAKARRQGLLDAISFLEKVRNLDQAKQDAAGARQTVEVLEKRLGEFRAQKAELEPQLSGPPFRELQTQADTIRGELTPIQKSLQQIEKSAKRGVCPTCQRKLSADSVTSLKARCEELESQLAGISSSADSRRALEQRCEVLDRDLQNFEIRVVDARSRVQQAEAKLVGFDGFDVNEMIASQAVKDHQGREARSSARYARLLKREAEVDQRLLSLAPGEKPVPPSVEVINLAEASIELEAKVMEMRTLAGALPELTRQQTQLQMIVAGLQRKVELLRQQRELLGKLEAWKQDAEKLCAVFHRDALPAAFTARVKARVIEDANLAMASLLPNWRLQLGVDGEIMAVETASPFRSLPSRQLSKGQRAMASLSLRLAAAIFTGANFLMVDEPTSNLDEQARARLRDFVGPLGDFVRARGLQVILVVHDPHLAAACHHVESLA